VRYSQSIAGLALAALLGATIYEALVALQVIELGSLPGDGPPGHPAVALIAAVAFLGAAAITLGLASLRPRRVLLPALLAPAAGAFLIAHVYTFDPYFLPSLIRYVDWGAVSPTLIFGLAAGAVVTGVLAYFRPTIGLALSAPAILACGLAALFSGAGH
jgi:hypothetical protein